MQASSAVWRGGLGQPGSQAIRKTEVRGLQWVIGGPLNATVRVV